MLHLYRYLDYGCIVYGSYMQMLDHIHNRSLLLCLKHLKHLLWKACTLMHTKLVWVLDVQYASKIKFSHEAVFDMKLLDTRSSAIRTFGLRIKQFLISVSTFQTCWKHFRVL